MNEKELLSISELAERFELDRATVSKRLGDFPFERGKKNAKLYNPEDVAALLDDGGSNPDLEAAKLRRAQADAEKAEILVAKLRGELVNRVEVLTEVQEIFARLYQTICIQYVRRNSGRLFKMKSGTELAEALQKDLTAIFDEIADENSFSRSNSGGNTTE